MKTKPIGDQFPITVKPGSVTVLINRIRRKTGYIYYQVRYYVDGVRQTRTDRSRKLERAAWPKITDRAPNRPTKGLSQWSRGFQFLHQ